MTTWLYTGRPLRLGQRLIVGLLAVALSGGAPLAARGLSPSAVPVPSEEEEQREQHGSKAADPTLQRTPRSRVAPTTRSTSAILHKTALLHARAQPNFAPEPPCEHDFRNGLGAPLLC